MSHTGACSLEVSGFGGAAGTDTSSATTPPDAPVSSTPASGGALLGGQLDAALRAWGSDFAGHKGGMLPTESCIGTTTTYATDLAIDGASVVTVTDAPIGDSRLAEFDSFAPESDALVAYKALVARVMEARMPCRSFGQNVIDLEALNSTTLLPFGMEGALAKVMLALELTNTSKKDSASTTPARRTRRATTWTGRATTWARTAGRPGHGDSPALCAKSQDASIRCSGTARNRENPAGMTFPDVSGGRDDSVTRCRRALHPWPSR